MFPGSAASCSRAAMFAASPIAVLSIRSLSATGPKTTRPVLMPMRIGTLTSGSVGPSLLPATARLIATAARRARRTWSSCAIGAPNSAMKPSPVNCGTVPPKRRTSAIPVSRNRRSSSCSGSAPIRSARPVELTMSQNRTVTCLNSPVARAWAGGSSAMLTGVRLALTSGAPHWPQNLFSAGLIVLQEPQRKGNGAPHWPQNRAPERFSP
jgi:hypothetical protein